MRYFNKAEREHEQKRAERRRWMTLVEAIKYIKDKERLGDHEALEDLFRAIVDGKLKVLCGDVSYEEDSISGYRQLSPDELQGELKICLDGPGYINLDFSSPRAKKPRADIIEYPKISIVAGPIAKATFDKSGPNLLPFIPKVDEYEYGPVLVARDNMPKWPFAHEEEPCEARSASSQVSRSAVSDVLSKGVEPTTSRRRGRPRGSGTYEVADAPLLTKMRELIDSGAAKSANDAAVHVAGNAGGSCTFDSKVARLARRCRAQFCSERK